MISQLPESTTYFGKLMRKTIIVISNMDDPTQSPKRTTCSSRQKALVAYFLAPQVLSLSLKSKTAATMGGAPRTFWGGQRIEDLKTGRIGQNLRNFCGFCFLWSDTQTDFKNQGCPSSQNSLRGIHSIHSTHPRILLRNQ